MPSVKLSTSPISSIRKTIWFQEILKIIGIKSMAVWEVNYKLSTYCQEHEKAGLGETTVGNYLREMAAQGILKCEKRYLGGVFRECITA